MAEQRVPPHDLDAEGAVLSAILMDPAALAEAEPILDERDFYSDANRLVWRAAMAVDASGEAVDHVAVAGWLRSRELLERVGGSPYLVRLTETPDAGHVATHARVVAAFALRRRVIDACKLAAAEGYGDGSSERGWAQAVEQRVYRAAQMKADTTQATVLSEVVPAVVDEVLRRKDTGDPPGLPTGFPSIDRKLTGLRRTMTYVIAGRPGMGKSALAGALAHNTAAFGRAAVVISTEMPASDMAKRMLASAASIPFQRLERAELEDDEWPRFTLQADRISKLPLAIHFLRGATVAGIRSAVRRSLARLRHDHGEHLELGLVVVDFLQQMNHQQQPKESTASAVGRTVIELTWVAGEFDVPLVLCSQLNRSVESRTGDKRPHLADLKESGTIEEAAYSVWFPFRPAYYDRTDDERLMMEPDAAEIIVAKHKNGPAPTIHMEFVPAAMRFQEADPYRSYAPSGTEYEEWHP